MQARALAYNHAAYLGEYINPRWVPQPFHEEWHDLCTDHDRLILFAPVEHGKSTQLSVIRPIWMLGHNPDLRLAIISSTLTQATKWLSLIKTNIEFNHRLRHVFPHLQRESRKGWPRAWYADAILVQRTDQAAMEEKDLSVQALGIMGRLLGARLDGAILDDVLGPDNTLTEGGREKVWNWIFSTLVGRIVEGGFIWCIGTAWHEEDAYHRIERELGHVYHVARYQAGEAPCIWPERWSPKRLEARATELGELEFNRQMLNIAIGQATQFFPMPRVRECQRLCLDSRDQFATGLQEEDIRQRFRWITAGLDLGMSEASGSHNSALAVIGLDKEDVLHLLHLRSGLWLGSRLLRECIDAFRMFHFRELMVETNAAQLHLATMLRDSDILAGLGVSKDEVRRFRVFGQYTTQYNRNDIKWGIRGMGTEFEALKWRMPQRVPEVEKLVDEMRRYTPWDHPGDRLVAMWLARARMRGRGKELPLRVHRV